MTAKQQDLDSSAAMRVALDITPMLGPPTGVHQTAAGLLGALRDRSDVDVTGYALTFRGRIDREVIGDLRVRSRHWPAALAHISWARSDIPRARWLVGPTDIVHGTNYTVPPADHGRVVTVQDLTLVTHPHWCTPQVTRMRGALERAVRRGAHVHVTSESSGAQAVAHLGVDPSRLHVIPVAVTPLGPGEADRGRRLAGIDDYVLALGTTEPRKNLPTLVEAMARLDRPTRLVVAGPQGPAEDDLRAAVLANGLADRFVRLGVLDRSARSDLMRGATALAYPSLDEGFGLPPLEALTVGCPVVATSVGALPELIGDHVELVPPGDPDALTGALEAVISGSRVVPPQLVERLEAMTWERAAELTVEVYRKALA